MNNYERMLDLSEQEGLIVKELPLEGNDGRIYGNRIAIRDSLRTTAEKACVLAEELGHYRTSSGDILDLNDSWKRKQEFIARADGYNQLVGLMRLVECFEAGCRNRFEAAEHLNVSEEFLEKTVELFRARYGQHVQVGDYIIFFEPCLGVVKKFDIDSDFDYLRGCEY